MTSQETDEVIEALIQADLVVPVESALITTAYVRDLARRADEVLGSYHAEHRLRPGMPAEEFRARLGLDAAGLARLSPLLTGVDLHGATAALRGFEPAPDLAQQAEIDVFLAGLREAPFSPPVVGTTDPEILAYLVDIGAVVHAGDGIVFNAAAFEEIARRVREHIDDHGKITLAQTRDMFGTSRKYAQALLEELDRMRVTRRVGDERVLR